MAEALLGIVIENLHSFMQQQLATFWSVDQQTERLSRNLTAIHAVLKDAEEKQITNHALKHWLQNLADAAYVLDDTLDECSIQYKKLNCEGQDSGSASFLAWFHPHNIVFRCSIGKRMKEITQRFHEIDDERRMFELHASITERQPEDNDELRQTISTNTEPKVYGRDQDIEQIVEFLLGNASNNEDISIYPIVGMGGVGKTTLVQRIFNDKRVSKNFDLTIWICVSNDFSVKRILISIIEYCTRKNPNLSSLEALQKEVQQMLHGKRYLLVLDDVWDDDHFHVKWEKLKSSLQCGSGTKGASVLVTTRLQSVAFIMRTNDSVHQLTGLSESDSWSLFKHRAFGPNREESEELVAIGKEIVRKCVGSPLAIKALGSLLHFKRDIKQWQCVNESKFWGLPEDNSIMQALKLSYFNLKLSLRRCFSFCALFPKDFEINREELIHLWMANGFIESRGSWAVEDVGNEMWNELYQRSFFQEVKTNEYGIITSFKMHDLFHDLAESIMGEECMISEHTRLTSLSKRLHHLHCLKSNESINMVAFKKVESLRTFLDFDSDVSRENFRRLPSNRSLRALRTSTFRLSPLKNLSHLRYLNLRKSWITSLPNFICGLKKLQILKLEDCECLYWLPKDLTRLQDLRHLVINRCYSIVEMPPKIGEFKHLKTLSTFIVGSKTGFGLVELHDLQLGGKLHIRGLENVPNEWDAQQANLIGKELDRLYLSWGSNGNSHGDTNVDPQRVLEALKPPPNLKCLGMKGYKGRELPSWMKNTSLLKGLVEVILYDCNNCEWLPPLGKLPCLKTLFLSGMKDVKQLDDDSYNGVEKAFPSLEKLTMWGLPNLERMLRNEGVEMLPRLSQLSICGISNLKLPCLPSVEHLIARNIEDGAFFMQGVVANMPCLKTMHIEAFNKLKVLPDELGKLSSLDTLFIQQCNELESFTENALQGLSSLRSLLIWNCEKLKSLSEGIGHLVCLESLNISECPKLVALPTNMNQLTALRQVSIMGNSLPEGLQRIPSLQRLLITGNPGPTLLPDWLGNMTSLRQIEIAMCRELRSLPSSFQQLTNLSKLDIFDSPKLEKRCKREIGEDWPYINHIPQIQLTSTENITFTFCENIQLAWKFSKFGILFAVNLLRHGYTEQDGFDSMVDE